jgi:ribosomal protein S18 acetylase RimI-like enzyme
MIEVTVSKLTAADRTAWESLLHAYLEFYETSIDQEAYDRAWKAFQQDEIMHALGGRAEGRLVGIVQFLTHASTTAADVCYLQDLYTIPEARGQGVARALINAVVEYAQSQGCSCVYWLTHESNTTARGLYDKVGLNSGFIQYEIEL